MRGTWIAVLSVLVLAVCPVAASAEAGAGGNGTCCTLSLTKDYTASPWTKDTGYWNRATHKLGFGLKNLLLGWTEFFSEPKEASEAHKSVWKGIGVGLKDGLENEVGGIVHIVTFPFTTVDAPLPEGGVQL